MAVLTTNLLITTVNLSILSPNLSLVLNDTLVSPLSDTHEWASGSLTCQLFVQFLFGQYSFCSVYSLSKVFYSKQNPIQFCW